MPSEKADPMSKRDAVLLISRAIAALELIAAFENVITLIRFFLNNQFVSGRLYAGWERQISGQAAILIFQLLVAFAFWRCGPRIATFLLPDSQRPQNSSQPA
jgi:hypothetical protein